MTTNEAVSKRIYELCDKYGFTPNGISNCSGISQSTVKSILNGESQNPGVISIKKLCDGFNITLAEFFDTDYFNTLEQEIK